MPKKIKKEINRWQRLTHVLLYGLSMIRKMPRPDKCITLHDDLIEIGATEQEARFLIRQARRQGIEFK